MHQTDAHAGAELALGGIEALTEPKRAEAWMRPVEIAAAGLLVVMIVTVLANVFFRYVLAKPLIWGDEVASIGFIWMAMLGAALAAAVMAFPLMVRAIRLAIEAVDPKLEQAASTLGAPRSWVFLTVTLPLILPGVIAGAILGFAKAMGEFGAVAVVSGKIRGKTATMPITIEMLYNEYLSIAAFSMAATLGVLGLVTLMIKTLLEIRHADALAAQRRH